MAIPVSCFTFMAQDYTKIQIIGTVVSALPINLYFAYIEKIQIDKCGFGEYISEGFNLNDIAGLLIYAAFSFIVLNNSLRNGRALDVFNFMMIISILLKIQSFLRVHKKFGLLVTLITTCFVDVFNFMIYLLIWMIAMTLLYKILGFSTSTTDYPMLDSGSFTNFFL